jgi:hypothetical protein
MFIARRAIQAIQVCKAPLGAKPDCDYFAPKGA